MSNWKRSCQTFLIILLGQEIPARPILIIIILRSDDWLEYLEAVATQVGKRLVADYLFLNFSNYNKIIQNIWLILYFYCKCHLDHLETRRSLQAVKFNLRSEHISLFVKFNSLPHTLLPLHLQIIPAQYRFHEQIRYQGYVDARLRCVVTQFDLVTIHTRCRFRNDLTHFLKHLFFQLFI